MAHLKHRATYGDLASARRESWHRSVAVALAALGVLALGPSACNREPRAYPPDRVPLALRGHVQAADGAIQQLQQRLAKRLFQEIERGGPVAAVTVCRDEAQSIARAVRSERRIAVGRTSDRLRNPANSPRPWAAAWVARAAGTKADRVDAIAVDLGDRVGVLRPIATGSVCVSCHGARERFAPELARLLRESYPEDRAVGFAEGDLRGFFWAEAPLSAR